MAVAATDCDSMTCALLNGETGHQVFSDPDGVTNLFHLTPRNEYEVYDEVDVEKQQGLLQEGKVVVVTGGGRGIGKVSAIASRVSLYCNVCAHQEQIFDRSSMLMRTSFDPSGNCYHVRTGKSECYRHMRED